MVAGGPGPVAAEGREVLRGARELLRQGRASEALDRLREALRRGQLDDEETYGAGRLVREAAHSRSAGPAPLRIFLAGQCTTSWLASALAAHALGGWTFLDVEEGEYDHVVQDLAALAARPGDRPDVIVLLPWNRRLFGDDPRPPEERVRDEVAFWRSTWDSAGAIPASRLIQIGYDAMGPGAEG